MSPHYTLGGLAGVEFSGKSGDFTELPPRPYLLPLHNLDHFSRLPSKFLSTLPSPPPQKTIFCQLNVLF